MKYKHIIFDLDGTLVDTSPDINSSINFVLKKLNLPESTLEQCKSYVGSGLRKTLSNALDDRNYKYSNDDLDNFYNDFESYYKDHAIDDTHPYDGIFELIKKLKEKGCTISVISNKEDSLAKKVVSNMFKNFEFDSIWGIGNNKNKKPDPEGYLWTKDKLNITDDNKVLFIGDSLVDRQFAINSKLEYKLVTWGFVPKEKLATIENNSRLVNNCIEIEKEIINE